MKERLTRKRIVDAAMSLVDADGLDALSMRKLAAALDAGTMSLYNHVPNKDALLDALVEQMLSDASGGEGSADAAVRLRELGHRLRKAAQDHPEVFRIIAIRPPTTPVLLRTLNSELRHLSDLGLGPAGSAEALRILFAFVFGYIRLETGGFFDALTNIDEIEESQEGELPEMTARAEHFAHWDPDVEFDQGLDVLLVGLRAAAPVVRLDA